MIWSTIDYLRHYSMIISLKAITPYRLFCSLSGLILQLSPDQSQLFFPVSQLRLFLVKRLQEIVWHIRVQLLLLSKFKAVVGWVSSIGAAFAGQCPKISFHLFHHSLQLGMVSSILVDTHSRACRLCIAGFKLVERPLPAEPNMLWCYFINSQQSLQ